MRVQYQIGNDGRTPLKLFYQDDIVGQVKDGMVIIRLNRLIEMIQNSHTQGRLNRPLVIAKVRKGERDG